MTRCMNLNIEWTPIALQSLSDVFEYTFEEFGERQARKLTSQIYKVVRRLSAFPMIGELDEECTKEFGVEYRHIVVISQISLMYTIVDDTVYIEYVRNARLDDSTVWDKMSYMF